MGHEHPDIRRRSSLRDPGRAGRCRHGRRRRPPLGACRGRVRHSGPRIQRSSRNRERRWTSRARARAPRDGRRSLLHSTGIETAEDRGRCPGRARRRRRPVDRVSRGPIFVRRSVLPRRGPVPRLVPSWSLPTRRWTPAVDSRWRASGRSWPRAPGSLPCSVRASRPSRVHRPGTESRPARADRRLPQHLSRRRPVPN